MSESIKGLVWTDFPEDPNFGGRWTICLGHWFRGTLLCQHWVNPPPHL